MVAAEIVGLVAIPVAVGVGLTWLLFWWAESRGW